MAKKYRALRIVATIYRVLGWIVLVGGILFSIIAGIAGIAFTEAMGLNGAGGAIIGIILGIIVFTLVGLGILAYADLIYVAIDIEENTRRQR